MNKKIQRQFKLMQTVRKLHRVSGLSLIVFLLIVSITGILLGWKKNSNELLMPDTYKGASSELRNWLPIDSLSSLALYYLHEAAAVNASVEINRIDIRPNKGVAKVSFTNYWMVQIDGANGELLHIGKRTADIIEEIHDGSIVDRWLGTSNGFFKLFFTSAMGLALILFIVTGFLLWFIPIRFEKQNI